jgi:hypothetical protein
VRQFAGEEVPVVDGDIAPMTGDDEEDAYGVQQRTTSSCI